MSFLHCGILHLCKTEGQHFVSAMKPKINIIIIIVGKILKKKPKETGEHRI